MNKSIQSLLATLCVFVCVLLLPVRVQGAPDENVVTHAGEAGATATSPPPASSSPAATISDNSYRLGTGDKLKVTVYGEDDLSGEYTVDGSGQIQFPLLGQVNASGLTVRQFVVEITSNLAVKYLRNPKVSVQIENYRPFYIMGEVNKPGEYPYENGLDVLGAVALAGGYTYRASTSDVYVRRSGSPNEVALPADGSTKIYAGDIVRVAERIF